MKYMLVPQTSSTSYEKVNSSTVQIDTYAVECRQMATCFPVSSMWFTLLIFKCSFRSTIGYGKIINARVPSAILPKKRIEWAFQFKVSSSLINPCL